MERISCSYDPTDDLRIDLAEARAEVERLRQREMDLTSEARGLHEALRKETAKVERLREALERIVSDADECPMEDMLSAGGIAREALDA